ncbi:MAG TPA: hypothetical protein VIL46_00620 [Gemmataceae bacterium]
MRSEDAGGVFDGWLYWPITAGGLGLTNPLIVAGQYREAYRRRKPVPVPAKRRADWDLRSNEWAAYYIQFLQELTPAEPKDTKVMKTLVDDFIARGADLSAGKRKGLKPYWRWVLHTYGPQVLEKFGTFRFLITELVLLQLIREHRLRDTSLGGRDEPAAGSAAPSPEDGEMPF